MRILAAMDNYSYSQEIIPDLARLASNTWSDITLLNVQRGKELDLEVEKTMMQYAKQFFSYLDGEISPYDPVKGGFKETGTGAWENSSRGRKEFVLKIRSGDPDTEILKEAAEWECDLIVLGCTKGMGCEWNGILHLPHKVARDATCSVMVIKETRTPSQIISFLDQTNVSQESLELINQMVTLHKAGLKIVGLRGQKGVIGKGDVEGKMLEILNYYNEKQIRAWITFVEDTALEEYVARSTSEGMVALWMGKKSFLSRIFSKDLLEKLIDNTQSSVLILR